MSTIEIKRKLHNYSMQEWNKVNIPIPKGNNWRIATKGQTKANQISIWQKLAPKALVIWQSLCGVVEPPLPWAVACTDFICFLQHSLSDVLFSGFLLFPDSSIASTASIPLLHARHLRLAILIQGPQPTTQGLDSYTLFSNV